MKTIPLHFAVLLIGCIFAQQFRPDIPRTWDEEVLRTMELPLATPEASPAHISAERYYSIPRGLCIRRIRATCPERARTSTSPGSASRNPRRSVRMRHRFPRRWIELMRRRDLNVLSRLCRDVRATISSPKIL